jgi:glycosyltransferase involved in cell wall biosynthesis
MAEEYRVRYGVEGRVLYPSRPPGSKPFKAPPERLSDPGEGLKVVFAGSLHIPGYLQMLYELAAVLRACKGSLVIHAPPAKQVSERFEGFKDVVNLLPLVPDSQLVDRLRAEADVLFLPMSFEERFRAHMRTSFPSKLTEYTAAGVPILIWGPPYCSSVRWARENPGVAEIVDENDVEQLADRLRRLASDTDHRIHLANNALRVGHDCFSHAAVVAEFNKGLTGSSDLSPACRQHSR